VGGARHAVSVQHHHGRLGAGQARDRRADLRLRRRAGRGRDAESPLAAGVAHLLGQWFPQKDDSGDEDHDELDRRHGARDQRRGSPRADEDVDWDRLLHGRTPFSLGAVTILPRVFVTFEGVDGSGKSTQADLLRESLEKEGRTVVTTREPGGTPLGERVRELLLDGEAMAAWSEAALFTAARAELVEHVIGPALAGGADVICDRYLDSSLAYQGVARGLGVERVLGFNIEAIRGILPDVTFLLLVDVDEARKRSADARDRIEREGAAFLSLVDNGYRQLASLFPQRIVAIDAGGPVHDIAKEVREHVQQRAGAA
jgi:dTMP kinase